MATKHALEDSVRAKYAELALHPDAPRSFATGPESAKALGYPPAWIDALPTAAVESFAGVGHTSGSRPVKYWSRTRPTRIGSRR